MEARMGAGLDASFFTLICRVQTLLDDYIGTHFDRAYTYCCFDSNYSHFDAFFAADGSTFTLGDYCRNFLSLHDVDLFCSAFDEAIDQFRSSFMEHREADEDLPTELYFTFDTRLRSYQSQFSYTPVMNNPTAQMHFRAWYVAHGGTPAPEQKPTLAERLKSWLNRDDPFQRVPSLEEVLADPPWGELDTGWLPALNAGSFSGWDAIMEEFTRLYPLPEQEGERLSSGRPDRSYVCSFHDDNTVHFVTLGLSELFEKKSNDSDVSGLGLELTLRLKKGDHWWEEAEKTAALLRDLMLDALDSGKAPRCYRYIESPASSPMTPGFLLVPDTKARELDTPNGRVSFIELVGITASELSALKNLEISGPELYRRLGSDLTDYSRKSVI
ncbi:MAG: suppressor of fused domain protein [Candidatus Limivicinus sp.]